MEIFEFVFELIFDGIVEVCTNENNPKIIRYPLIAIIVAFFVAIIGLLFKAGVIWVHEDTLYGVVAISFGALILILVAMQFHKFYLTRRKKS